MIMNSLKDYILEAFKEFKITNQWMINKYKEFNSIYFNDELPNIALVELKVCPIQGHSLGMQGFNESYYISKDKMAYGKYIMLKKEGHRYLPVDDPQNELSPYIHLSSKYKADELQWEDTLLHEMVHLYTYKDGYAPKQAHGKEFRAICDKIRKIAKEQYGKDYELEIYARRKDNFSLTDEEQAKVIARNERRAHNTVGIYIELDSKRFPKRFLFTSRNSMHKVIKEIKNTSRVTELLAMYLTDDSYEKMRKEYGKFPVGHSYTFFDVDRFPKATKYMKQGNNVLDEISNESLDEAKKEYIQPSMTVIELDKDVNLSDINLEDILNQIKDEDIKGDPEIIKNIIDPNDE